MSSVLRNRPVVFGAVLFVTLLMMAGLGTHTSRAASADWEWQKTLPQVHTANGGSIWTPQSTGIIDALYGVSAVDANNAWAVGGSSPNGRSTILHTTDAGSTWTPQNSGTPYFLRGVSAVNASTAWAVGERGTIRYTTDAGSTWTGQYTGTSSTLHGVSGVNASTAWAVGKGTFGKSAILHTTDGGSTWTFQDSGNTEWLFGVSAVDANNAWAVGTGGTILHTTDGGSTWTPQTMGIPCMLHGVSAFDASNAWAVGTNGTIVHTTDGGSTWTPQNSGTTSDIFGVSAVDASNAWAVGGSGTILQTTAAGSTWTPQSTGTIDALLGVSAADANNVWAVGGDGTILHAGAATFYFAEGTCRPGFDPYICIQNPGGEAATVTITYMKGDGTTDTETLTVSGNSRSTVVVKNKLGEGNDAAHDFSAKVECTNGQQIIAERPMYFNYRAGEPGYSWQGGHDVVGALAPDTTFYFAEGTCRPGFDPYICIQNPGGEAATVTITYMKGDGTTDTETLTVSGNSRSTVVVKNKLGEGNDAAHDFSAKVECTKDFLPIIAERPMYFNYRAGEPGYSWQGGHDVVGL